MNKFMNNETDVLGLIETKRKLEGVIEVYNTKIAAVRKRLDALSTAINVLRSSDEELEGIVSGVPNFSKSTKNYTAVSLVNDEILEYSNSYNMVTMELVQFKTKELKQYLENKGIIASDYSIYKFLNSGKFNKIGDSQHPTWQLKKDEDVTEMVAASQVIGER